MCKFALKDDFRSAPQAWHDSYVTDINQQKSQCQHMGPDIGTYVTWDFHKKFVTFVGLFADTISAL